MINGIGKMTNRITYQILTQTLSTSGNPIETFTDYYTCWCQMIPFCSARYIGISLAVLAGEIRPETTGVLKQRYHAGLDPSMKIRFGTRYLKIMKIVDIEENTKQQEVQFKEWVDVP